MRRALTVAALALLAMTGVDARSHHRVAAEMPTLIDASNIDSAFASLEATNVRSEFAAFKKLHNKRYESAEHEEMRFQLFKDNMAEAARLSKLNPEAKFGITRFSDLHPTEFKRRYLNFEPAVGDKKLMRSTVPVVDAPIAPEALPTNFDWRNPSDGRPVAVTPVKDQGQCGSCWAFSATEAVESSWIMAGKPMAILAPQQTVDCDTQDGGCNGGDTVTAYQYMKGAGVEGEKSYPYFSGNTGNAGNCQYNATAVIAKINGFVYATPGCTGACTSQNEAQLASNLVANGPVSICVDASTWQNYQSGIMTSASGCSSNYNNLDHCVQLVGYGVEGNVKFWSVRNSWNTGWGEQGYIRLKYGANTCGVADEATQPTI